MHDNRQFPSSSVSSILQHLSGADPPTRVIVVSNREPIIHEHSPSGIIAIRPASGVVTGLEPIVRAVNGTWIAHGSGSADRHVVDEKSRVSVSSGAHTYQLRRVWLTRKEEAGYYYGLANDALWPLCHIVYTRPNFHRSDWEMYKRVNEKFCEVVLDEVGDERAVVLIQDYHLALLPRMLRNRKPDLTVAQFWHIPWPNREAFRIFPWGEELLDGLLGNDVLGFHIQYHCNNFLDTVDRGIEALVDYEHFRVTRGGRPTIVRPFPISVDDAQIGVDTVSPAVENRMAELRREYSQPPLEQRFIVGVDRIDYTKGILERLRGFDLLLTEHPELAERVTFLNFCAPSRTHVVAYRELNDRIDELVDDINWRHQTDTWVPVRFLRAHHDYATVLAAYRLADVLMVTSLHDGMNLVAKEYISARVEHTGVLILSKYTGAARELEDALHVNPYDAGELSDRLYESLMMTDSEQSARMTRLRETVQRNSVYTWAGRIFEDVERIHRSTGQ